MPRASTPARTQPYWAKYGEAADQFGLTDSMAGYSTRSADQHRQGVDTPPPREPLTLPGITSGYGGWLVRNSHALSTPPINAGELGGDQKIDSPPQLAVVRKPAAPIRTIVVAFGPNLSSRLAIGRCETRSAARLFKGKHGGSAEDRDRDESAPSDPGGLCRNGHHDRHHQRHGEQRQRLRGAAA